MSLTETVGSAADMFLCQSIQGALIVGRAVVLQSSVAEEGSVRVGVLVDSISRRAAGAEAEVLALREGPEGVHRGVAAVGSIRRARLEGHVEVESAIANVASVD